MEQRVRELLEDDHLDGDLDELVDRISKGLEADGISSFGRPLLETVVVWLLDNFRGKLDQIPDDLYTNLFDYGYLEISADDGLAAMRKRLTKEELEVVDSLESHMSVVQTNFLIAGLQNSSSPINGRVLATLNWYGLQALSMIMDQAAARLFETKSKNNEPDEALEQAYEDLCDIPLFFPQDSDEFEMGEEEEKAKRRETESAMLDRVEFFKPSKPKRGLGRGMR